MDNSNGGQPLPGQTVAPTGSQPTAGRPAAHPPAPAGQTPAPSGPQQPRPRPPVTDQEPEVELGTQTDDGDTVTDDRHPGPAPDSPSVRWTASEFIDHDKRSGWYAVLGLSAAVFAGLVYLISRDLISVIVILVAAVVFGIYAGHKPRQMEYRLDAGGLSIGQKRFRWNDFRSFAVVEEGAIPSIVFMPLKRFAVPTTIYYPQEEEDSIVGVLAGRLPMEQRGHDAIDRLMHRIRY